MNRIELDVPEWILSVLNFTIMVVLGVLALAVGLAAFVVPIGIWVNHSGHVSCLRLSEQTSLATRYARSGIEGECYVQVDGKWIPEDRWRAIDGDS